MNLNAIAGKIDTLWKEHHSFNGTIKSWLEQIEAARKLTKAAKQHFHQWYPLSAYVKVGAGVAKNTFRCSLRFAGQEVASLVVKGAKKGAVPALKPKDVQLVISKGQAESNQTYFDQRLPAGRYGWSSEESRGFRKHFMKQAGLGNVKPHSPEHMIESRIIKEMARKSRGKFCGKFSGIQPVTVSGLPLQFPLPISASSGMPKVSNGHIDILARRRSGGVCLSVWELKAPGAYGTPLHQVYIYALTLLKMIRDPELGPKWYEVFGFSGKIPASLRIEGVVAVTPDQKSSLDDEFATLGTSPRLGMDTIELYAAYYDKDSLEVAFQKL